MERECIKIVNILRKMKDKMLKNKPVRGKTFSFVEPKLYQVHSSYVLIDTKGISLSETRDLFERADYRIKVLDTIDFNNSMHYNPFAYIKEPEDISTLATSLLMNLQLSESNRCESFFDQAALLWLQATIGYLCYEASVEKKNINSLLEILEADLLAYEVQNKYDENYKNVIDMLFEELEERSPSHFAVEQRNKYKQTAGEIAKHILITLKSTLSVFNIPEVAELLKYDELELDTYDDEGQKTILYVIVPGTDTSYDVIPAVMLTQMFNVLCYKEDEEIRGGELKTPVKFILDNFRYCFKYNSEEIFMTTPFSWTKNLRMWRNQIIYYRRKWESM